ncbi:HIT family protein [Streptomyces sp. NPDC001933]|uniref:HIT family protein n=1 Tax=Streptomyces sp. NPDC001933 TaxID=3364626 RepID=UPI0036B24DD5
MTISAAEDVHTVLLVIGRDGIRSRSGESSDGVVGTRYSEHEERLVAGDGCVFCSIVHGQADASIVHEDESVVAFMDLRPVNPGHLLVVPKTHAVGLEDLQEDAGVQVWKVAHRLGRALRRSGLRCEGVNLLLADGEAAFQEVFHVHLHVIPRFTGDPFRIDSDWLVHQREQLDETSAAVRNGLAALDISLR